MRIALRVFASPRHSECHCPPPNGGPSHHATRPGWLKIDAAPFGQPGSAIGLFPSPPVINAAASRMGNAAIMIASTMAAIGIVPSCQLPCVVGLRMSIVSLGGILSSTCRDDTSLPSRMRSYRAAPSYNVFLLQVLEASIWKSRHHGVKMTTCLPGADLGERER